MRNKKSLDYLEIKYQYNNPGRPHSTKNPFIQSPITERINEYRLRLSFPFLVNKHNIIPKRLNNAKIMNKTKYIRLLIISPQDILSIIPNIGTRNPPEKPIIEIARIILLSVFLSKIRIWYLFINKSFLEVICN
jgi:hypothetical protein